MRAIMGVRVRGNGLQRTEYRCVCCGIIKQYEPSRAEHPVWCEDCKGSGYNK